MTSLVSQISISKTGKSIPISILLDVSEKKQQHRNEHRYNASCLFLWYDVINPFSDLRGKYFYLCVTDRGSGT